MRAHQLACALLVTAAAPLATAHTLLTAPTPRSPSDGLKTGPCGDVTPTGEPTSYQAGSTITVTWLETIDHPGYYRIAFSLVGDGGYDDGILLDDIPDTECGTPPCPYAADVTLPSEPCEGCSLQIIQYMGTQAPYSLYFSCADITLAAAPQDEPDPDGPPGDNAVGRGGGCSLANGGTSAGWLILALGLALVRRRRPR